MDLCLVCDRPVNVEGDIPVEPGGLARTVPGDGATRCSSCDLIIHEACLAANGRWCKSCAACDACGRDASMEGQIVVRGTAELAPQIGTHAQELLCADDYRVCAGLAA